MSLYGWFVVILVTSAAVLLGVGWLMEHADRQYERVKLLAEIDQATANVQLPKTGHLAIDGPLWCADCGHRHYGNGPRGCAGPYLPGPPFAGASQTGQPDPVPWDLAGAAYQLGQQRASQDEVTREVDAIIAEVESDPKWRQR